ncbi:cytochrome c peroxidase [Methylomicrobium sp. Wu6]|uniref:cytochrome-c peroxidase n=1 Tax=Methylomicrobium sp. Wu6 TaxID=3107928 RepID=UPI002DD69AE2|nr:cytochrome c peroxidase [Methylomicrobium sp. Wu6]MEC4748228.1 cytochrome c peroxidase [Methylomicrobium sp. Wu6]
MDNLEIKRMARPLRLCVAVVSLSMPGLAMAHGSINAQTLRGVKVPPTPGLVSGKSPIVVDQTVAVQLGKALFWDTQVGSDGVACASCHFHAGADRRTRNQLGSGILHVSDMDSARTFDIGGPDYELKAGDFPLFRFADPANKDSAVVFSTDDVVSSAGAFLRQFNSVNESGDDGHDSCETQNNAVFHIGALNSRQATKRNAPSVINAAFNFRNFWDGRANNLFNGVSAFGSRDPDARVWVAANNGKAKKKHLLLANAALASQAVAPPLDMMEMSCQGRTFRDLGRKLLQRRPLESQQVHPEDSVLGAVRDVSGYGLDATYGDLIKKAFEKRFWSGKGDFGAANSGAPYSQMEANFAFFFGLAIQLYENTLIADRTPFDGEVGDDGLPVGYTQQQKDGFAVFQDAHCSNCHSGPTFSAAINPEVYAPPGKKLEYYPLVDRTVLTEQGDNFGVDRTLIDTGFADTSVVPNDYDAGLGGTDPYGNPLSFAGQYMATLADPKKKMVDPVKILACELDDPFTTDFLSSELIVDTRSVGRCKGYKKLSRVPSPAVVKAELEKTDQGRVSAAVNGAFKIPTLRNIELTGPYMHNGGMKSLEEVVEFYNRGGNAANRHHFSTLVFQQGFTAQERADLVAFLKTLTDERVRWERAPFDHPELWVPHGHEDGMNALGPDLAKDSYINIPAVGRNGRTIEQGPLLPFENYLKP